MKLFLALVFAVLCSLPSAANLIANGDFEAGYTDFFTDYTLWTGGLNPAQCEEAEYGVSTAAINIHGAWTPATDHTSGEGLYFIANGSSDTSASVWRSNAPIVIEQAGTPYRFEAWITSVYTVGVGSPGPELTFQVGNGVDWFEMGVSEVFPNGYTPGQWRLSYYDGVFESTGSYYVRLINSQSALTGNDLGVDDIYFGLSSLAPSIGLNPLGGIVNVTTTPIPEPTSALLLMVAFLSLLLSRRVVPLLG